MMKTTILAAVLATALAVPVLAQGTAQSGHGHTLGGQQGTGGAPMPGMAHGMQMAPGAAQAPSTPGYVASMERMMRDMPPITGNADRDFAAQMIPHHQAAIDMARVQLQHGRDPDMRRMAEEIIAAQEREITQLRTFLARQSTR